MAKILPPRTLTWPYMVAGVVLLHVWLLWWLTSLGQIPPNLRFGRPIEAPPALSTVSRWSVIGVDFQHNFAATKTWLSGEDPYLRMTNDPMNWRYVYPPLTLAMFSWVRWLPDDQGGLQVTFDGVPATRTFFVSLRGLYIWMAVIVEIMIFAAWRSWRSRVAASLPPLPLVFVIAVTLLSYPVMFELERGNCDVLPLLAIIGLAGALKLRNRIAGDLAVAACFTIAAGIKAYPGILLIGLVALRRYRAAIFSAAALALLVGLTWKYTAEWLAAMRALMGAEPVNYFEYLHAITLHWRLMWRDVGLPFMAAIPATPAIAIVLLAAIGEISWKIFRAKVPVADAWPYLLWVTATGTFATRISADYNLLYLPLALIAVWDRRDVWWTQLIAFSALLWIQPLDLGIHGLAWQLLKLGSALLIGRLVLRHMLRTTPEPAASGALAAARA